jgi:hypothetical protein
MVVRVKWDQSGLRKHVEKWMLRHVPFVLTRALNATIREAQQEMRDELPSTFTIRNRWASKGIRVNFASKARPVAEVGTVDEFMARQILGGTKRPDKVPDVAIPMVGRGKGRPKKTSLTRESRWPKALKRKRKAFYKEGAKGAKLLMIPIVRGKSRRLSMVYVLVPEIKIRARWDIEKTLDRVAKAEWRDNVKIAWERALRSARKR